MHATITSTDSGVIFRNARGAQVRGTPVRISREAIVFEVYTPYPVVEAGEEVTNLKVIRNGHAVYSGGAVVDSVLSTGWNVIIAASPVGKWAHADDPSAGGGRLFTEADARALGWDDSDSLLPAYQLAVTNVRSYLTQVGRWIAQFELPGKTWDWQSDGQWPTQVAQDTYGAVGPRLRQLFDRLEDATGQIGPDDAPAHRAYVQRELHPLMLCAPFVHRAYTKPLGYAGDYETVNMILRNRMEGPSLYAGILHQFVLSADTGEGHRNRIKQLVDDLSRETGRVVSGGRRIRVLNVGCGPAEEICSFIKDDPRAEQCDFTLLDFNRETIEYARERIATVSREAGRHPEVTFVHRSVNELIKEAARGKSDEVMHGQDLVYCAGLFDYLSDRICTRLLHLFDSWVQPGGLVVSTNVHPGHRSHAMMEDVLDWHLILRTEADMLALAPEAQRQVSVKTEAAGVNVFLNLRKPG